MFSHIKHGEVPERMFCPCHHGQTMKVDHVEWKVVKERGKTGKARVTVYSCERKGSDEEPGCTAYADIECRESLHKKHGFDWMHMYRKRWWLESSEGEFSNDELDWE